MPEIGGSLAECQRQIVQRVRDSTGIIVGQLRDLLAQEADRLAAVEYIDEPVIFSV